MKRFTKVLAGITLATSFAGQATAQAENPVYQAQFGDVTHVAQAIGDDVMYCVIGEFNECYVVDQIISEEGKLVFKRGAVEITATEDSFMTRNTVNDFERSADEVAVIDGSLSAAPYDGNWSGRNTPTGLALLSIKGNKAKVRYTFDGKPSTRNATVEGSVITIKFGGGAVGRFMQVGETTYGYYTAGNNNAVAVMTAGEFTFANDGVCVQSYLNVNGFPVGKADGSIGPGTKRGATGYLEANPDTDLAPLEKSNAAEWCKHFAGISEEDPGVIAIVGLD